MTDRIDPGPGWRLLELGEIKPKGYEWWSAYREAWSEGLNFGEEFKRNMDPCRVRTAPTREGSTMPDPMTKVTSFDSNLGRIVNAHQSLFQCAPASGPEHCDGCAAKGNHHLCEEIQVGFDCAEGEVFILKNSTPAFIQKWMGYFINSKGELDCMTWDHNPGHLAHAFVVNVPVPRQVQEDYLARPTCLILDKFGKPKA